MLVLKVGGRQLDEPQFLSQLAETVRPMVGNLVIVHGGGKGTSNLSERLGLRSRFVDGLRVTDSDTLECAVMGLAGLAKMQLVPALVRQGLPALGLTGADAGLVICRKLSHPSQDLGHVGEPAQVQAGALRRLTQAGFLVCLSPLCLDADGRLYNVNADPVAGAVASALEAEALVFVTDVGGVLLDGQILPEITPARCRELQAAGQIGPGMLPKLHACFAALEQGVRKVLITNLKGLPQQAGTWIHHG